MHSVGPSGPGRGHQRLDLVWVATGVLLLAFWLTITVLLLVTGS